MILKLLYREKAEEYNAIEYRLRRSEDPLDQSRDVVVGLLAEGPPSEMWFALEDVDDEESVVELFAFSELIRPYVGTGKFPVSKRKELLAILQEIQKDEDMEEVGDV
jgi:hypothetical protein